MAVIANNNQVDDQKKGQNSLNPLQTIGTAAPAAPVTGTTAPNTSATSAGGAPAAQPQGSGRFTNIQKYLTANKTGGQQIANGIQNSFDKQANQVAQGVQNAQGSLDRSTNPLQQQLGQQGADQLKSGFQDPNAILADQSKLNDFRQLQTGYSQGISNVADTEKLRQQQLSQQAQGLADTAGLAGTEAGRFELLRKSLASPAYSQGAQRLDQVLLGSQNGVAANLQQGLNNTVDQNTQGISGLEQDRLNKVNALKALSNERQTQWNGLLTDGVSADQLDGSLQDRGLADIMASSQQRLAQAQLDKNTTIPAMTARLKAGTATSADLQRLGLSDLAGTKTYDVDTSQFLAQNVADPTLTSAADKNEVDRYNSLRQLAGIDQLGGSAFGDASTAGTYNPLTYNKDALNQALTSAKSKFQVGNVDQIIDQMQRSGYFDGERGGSGMRSADGGASYRQASGAQLRQLQADYAAGKINADDYYKRVTDTVKNVWAGAGVDENSLRGSDLYNNLFNYQNTLNGASQAQFGVQSLPTNPQATSAANAIDWNAIKQQMSDSGYTLPTNKGGGTDPVLADAGAGKKI